MDAAGAGATDTVVWVVAGIAALTLISMVILRGAARRKEDSNPLTTLFERSGFEERMGKTAMLSANSETTRGPRTAVLSGRLDHMGQVGQIWGADTRTAAIEQVAQVMRAGVRKTDHFSSGRSDDFTILANGASEDEASGIARRLMAKLAQLPVPGMEGDHRLTATIAVAERLDGESDEQLRTRADAARDGASRSGEDRVVAASEWEEIRFLAAPAASIGDERAEDGSAVA